jgi:hypothetical protein
MSVVAIPRADEWVSGCQAKKLSGLTWYMLHKHVMLGKIRTLVEMARPIRYHKADCERLAIDRKTRSDVSSLSKKKAHGASNTGALEDARETVTRGGRRRETPLTQGIPHGQS